MFKLLPAASVLVACVATAAFAQTDTPRDDLEPLPPPLPGPIVGGKDIQPTQEDIMEREMLLKQGDRPTPSPDPGGVKSDKELDQLYEELMQQSKPSQPAP